MTMEMVREGQMMTERRNDIGGKIVTGVVAGLLGIIMSISYYQAKDAMGMAVNNKVEVGVLQTHITHVNSSLKEIKSDVKLLLKRR